MELDQATEQVVVVVGGGGGGGREHDREKGRPLCIFFDQLLAAKYNLVPSQYTASRETHMQPETDRPSPGHSHIFNVARRAIRDVTSSFSHLGTTVTPSGPLPAVKCCTYMYIKAREPGT